MITSFNTVPVQVFCHLKPLSDQEKDRGSGSCVQNTDVEVSVQMPNTQNPESLTFNGVFGPESSQAEVFEKAAKPVIDGLVNGYNGTIFTYGESASGKTYIMHGPEVIDSDDKPGIILRTMDYLFDLIGISSNKEIDFKVEVSLLEIYTDKVIDLLDPKKVNLQFKEEKLKGIFVQDLTEVNVSSANDMKQLYEKGLNSKVTSNTRMNCRSARSHVGFIIHVHQKDAKSGAVKYGKLYLLDLAGPEHISRAGATGQVLKEAESINKSLSTLDSVVNALSKKELGHVPYRESKLTRLLQDSLGGNSQTALILACSVSDLYCKETLKTLKFGKRVQKVMNAPIANTKDGAQEQ